MNKIEGYDIIEAYTKEELVGLTRQAIEQGYIPWGGPVILNIGVRLSFYQGIVKHSSYTKDETLPLQKNYKELLEASMQAKVQLEMITPHLDLPEGSGVYTVIKQLEDAIAKARDILNS